MARHYKFAALVNAKPEADEAFNEWHSGTHLPQVVKAAGFSNGRRMRLVDGTAMGMGEGAEGTSYKYLVLFDLDSDDPMAALGKMGEAVQSGSIEMSDSLGSPIFSGLYEEIPGATYQG